MSKKKKKKKTYQNVLKLKKEIFEKIIVYIDQERRSSS